MKMQKQVLRACVLCIHYIHDKRYAECLLSQQAMKVGFYVYIHIFVYTYLHIYISYINKTFHLNN